MFGAVNALFSGLAFAVIFWSLEAQHQELKEVKEQRQEQNELAALAAYMGATTALWQNNFEQFRTKQPHPPDDPLFWKKATEARHRELMHARSACEKILQKRGVL
jgi:hypothetical protein